MKKDQVLKDGQFKAMVLERAKKLKKNKRFSSYTLDENDLTFVGSEDATLLDDLLNQTQRTLSYLVNAEKKKDLLTAEIVLGPKPWSQARDTYEFMAECLRNGNESSLLKPMTLFQAETLLNELEKEFMFYFNNGAVNVEYFETSFFKCWFEQTRFNNSKDFNKAKLALANELDEFKQRLMKQEFINFKKGGK